MIDGGSQSLHGIDAYINLLDDADVLLNVRTNLEYLQVKTNNCNYKIPLIVINKFTSLYKNNLEGKAPIHFPEID